MPQCVAPRRPVARQNPVYGIETRDGFNGVRDDEFTTEPTAEWKPAECAEKEELQDKGKPK